ncbi:MAG: hypothetical protein ACTSX6_13895 [Candidatus Heimdallarchaeaceae archaeon]
MKTPKIICLVIVISLMFIPLVIKPTISQIPPYETGNWDFSGKRHLPKHRQLIIPLEGQDKYRMRTFAYFLDSDEDLEGTVDTIVAIFGVQSVRNAPFFSDFFEETSVTGLRATYSFSLETESGIDWLTLTDDVKNTSSPNYDPLIDYIYRGVESKAKIFVKEVFDPSLTHLAIPIHLAYLNQTVGTVGYWQIIYDDGTLVNGNFTTYGVGSPLFVDPKDPENEAYWWPQYNLTIAQNVGRSSLPRSHDFKVSISFLSILSGIAVLVLLTQTVKFSRRLKK